MGEQVSVSRDIAAPAERVWALISDVTRMGEWSPETVGATWLGRAVGPAPGARFRGRNRNGRRTWTTVATVLEAEPGRSFAFRVKAGPFDVADWAYRIEPTAAGCRVTETWTDRRGRLVAALGRPVSGVADRASHNRATMARTLDNLAAAAESGGGAASGPDQREGR
jgi:uncharacterized protein YndB with AHSA1/START domain